MLPLEERQRLVDQGKHVHAHGLGQLLHLDGGVELLDGLLVLALVQEQLTVIVIHIGDLVEVLDAATEGGHGGRDGAHLVLRNTELDVGEDKVAVQIDRLLVVLGRLGELALDEVQLRTVVVDIRVISVLGQREVKIFNRLVGCTCRLVLDSISRLGGMGGGYRRVRQYLARGSCWRA